MKLRLPRIWNHPLPADDLNEPDAEHTVHVPTIVSYCGIEESVYARPEAADHWDARVWRDNP